MTMLASQITSLTVVYSIVYSGVNQRKHQSSASLAFVWEIHRGPVNFPHKWPVTRKMFPFDDVIMIHSGNGMLSDDTKPLLGPMLISHQWCFVTLTWGQFQRKRRRYSWKEFENYSFEITAAHDPEANKLTQLDWRSSTGVFHLPFRKPWCRDKMAANLQRTFSQCIFLNENIWISIKISLKIVPKCPINNILLFILWLGSDQATSHYLDQWWYVYWRIYASLGLIMDSHIYIYILSPTALMV